MIKVQESMGTGNEGSWRAVGWSVGLCEFFKGPMKLGNDPFLAKGTNFLSTAVEVCGTALQEGRMAAAGHVSGFLRVTWEILGWWIHFN